MKKLSISLLAVLLLTACNPTDNTKSFAPSSKEVNIVPNKMRGCQGIAIEETKINFDGKEVINFRYAAQNDWPLFVKNYEVYHFKNSYKNQKLLNEFFGYDLNNYGYNLQIEKSDDGTYSKMLLADIPFIKTSMKDEEGKDIYISNYKNNKLILTDVSDVTVYKIHWKIYKVYNDTILKNKKLKKVITISCGYEFDIGEDPPSSKILEEFLIK